MFFNMKISNKLAETPLRKQGEKKRWNGKNNLMKVKSKLMRK